MTILYQIRRLLVNASETQRTTLNFENLSTHSAILRYSAYSKRMWSDHQKNKGVLLGVRRTKNESTETH